LRYEIFGQLRKIAYIRVSETETVLEKAYELITEDLVKEALEKNKGQDAKLISFHLKPFTKKGDNFLSIIVSVEIHVRRYRIQYMNCNRNYIKNFHWCIQKITDKTLKVIFYLPLSAARVLNVYKLDGNRNGLSILLLLNLRYNINITTILIYLKYK
ncbi:hypothetical protein Avbf_14429, partial [Armadillidium vulgare]